MVEKAFCITHETWVKAITGNTPYHLYKGQPYHVSPFVSHNEVHFDVCEGPFATCPPPDVDWAFVFDNEPQEVNDILL